MAADPVHADDAPAADRGIELLMLKLRARDEVSREEERAIRDAVAEVRRYEAGRAIVRAGKLLSECNLLIEGFIGRYKDLRDGQRQVIELHVPGDFVDLHSLLLKKLDHNVGALSPVAIAVFEHESIRRITETHPHLSRLLWFSTLLDSAIHREKILTVGRRSAAARVAHVLCELDIRLGVIGMAADGVYRLPLTQVDIADATGLTSVHVNRMLKQLRNDRLVTFRGGEVQIHDRAGLERVAGFDPAYLHLERHPR